MFFSELKHVTRETLILSVFSNGSNKSRYWTLAKMSMPTTDKRFLDRVAPPLESRKLPLWLALPVNSLNNGNLIDDLPMRNTDLRNICMAEDDKSNLMGMSSWRHKDAKDLRSPSPQDRSFPPYGLRLSSLGRSERLR